MAITKGGCTLSQHEWLYVIFLIFFFSLLLSVRKLSVCTEIEIPHRTSAWMSTLFSLYLSLFLFSFFQLFTCTKCTHHWPSSINFCRNMNIVISSAKKKQHQRLAPLNLPMLRPRHNYTTNITNKLHSILCRRTQRQRTLLWQRWKGKRETEMRWLLMCTIVTWLMYEVMIKLIGVKLATPWIWWCSICCFRRYSNLIFEIDLLWRLNCVYH